MSRTLEELTVKIGIDQKGLDKGLKKADSGFKKVGKNFAKVGAGIAAAGAAVGLALFKMGRAAAKAGDDIAKNAQKAGVSAQVYQELGFVFSQTGTEISGLPRIMKAVTTAIRTAEMGTKEYQQALVDTGVAVRNSSGELRDQEDIFRDIISGLAGMSNETERNIAAQLLLGRGAQELAPLLNAQEGTIERLSARFNELNLAMSPEELRQAEAYTDAMDELKRVFDRMKTSLGSGLLPVLLDLSDTITNRLAPKIPEIRQFFERWGTEIIVVTGAITGAGGLIAVLGLLAIAIGALGGPITAIIGGLAAIVAGVVVARRALTDMVSGADRTRAQIAALKAEFSTMSAEIEEAGGATAEERGEIVRMYKEMRVLQMTLEQQEAAFGGQSNLLEEFRRETEAAADSVRDFASSEAGAAGAIAEVNAQLQRQAALSGSLSPMGLRDFSAETSAEDLEGGLTPAIARLGAVTQTVGGQIVGTLNNRVGQALSRLETIGVEVGNVLFNAFEDVASAVGDALVDALFEGENAFKSFGNAALTILKDVIRELARMAARMAALSIFESVTSGGGLFGFLGDIAGAFFGGGGGGGGGPQPNTGYFRTSGANLRAGLLELPVVEVQRASQLGAQERALLGVR